MTLDAQFDAVVFDCDGCLIDSEKLVIEVLSGALAELGLDPGQRDLMGMSDTAFFGILNDQRMARHGLPLPQDFPELCHGRMRAATDRLTVIEGVDQALTALALPKAVASGSASASLKRKLTHVGLWDAFDPHIYSAEQVARGKPAPDVFLHAAERLGVDPARCLAIEDSRAGVRAAAAAGMTVWGFAGGGHMRDGDGPRLLEVGACRVVEGWAEAEREFRGWR